MFLVLFHFYYMHFYQYKWKLGQASFFIPTLNLNSISLSLSLSNSQGLCCSPNIINYFSFNKFDRFTNPFQIVEMMHYYLYVIKVMLIVNSYVNEITQNYNLTSQKKKKIVNFFCLLHFPFWWVVYC